MGNERTEETYYERRMVDGKPANVQISKEEHDKSFMPVKGINFNYDKNEVTATVNGKLNERLTKTINQVFKGTAVTDLEKNEALTRKLEKLKDKLEVDYVKEIEAMSNDALEEKVLAYAKEVERIEDEKKSHKELNAAKSRVSVLNKGFNDTK